MWLQNVAFQIYVHSRPASGRLTKCNTCRLPVPSPASRARHATRLLTACFGVVMFAILVVAKYTTDDGIRGSLYTYRTYNLKDAQALLGGFDYRNGVASPPNVVCPCSRYQISLSEFMTYSFVDPRKAYRQELPLCQISRQYGPLSEAPENNPGPNGTDFGCAVYFQAGAYGDEDYTYGNYCNSFYSSLTCKSTDVAMRADPSVSTTVSSSQLLDPRQLNESVALSVHGEHLDLMAAVDLLPTCTWLQRLYPVAAMPTLSVHHMMSGKYLYSACHCRSM